MEYEDWLEDVEMAVWALLDTRLSEFDDVDFEELFDDGLTPEEVANYLIDEER